jgi:MSHA biogenesis protein MshO
MHARGFTLIELVIVIVLIGILSVGSVQFIRQSSDGYASAVVRTELASGARIAVERLSREMRHALPNSVRVSGSCIEFVETRAAGAYLEAPVGTAAASFLAGPLTGVTNGTLRAAVFPDTPPAIYALASPGPISPIVAGFVADPSGQIEVQLDLPHAFAHESPQRRFFLVGEPVSFCVDGGHLWRYRDYGFHSVQPGPASLPGAPPQRALIGDGITAAGAPFRVSGATLTRNAVVVIELTFSRGGDALDVNHLVVLRNVP